MSESDNKMKVVFFFSGGASSMKAVLEDPSYKDSNYVVAAAVTNRVPKYSEKGRGIAADHKIPVVHLNTDEYERNEEGRSRYYKEQVTPALKEIGPNIIGLSGFLKKFSLMPREFVNGEYKNKIINVHPADLSILSLLEGEDPIDLGREYVNKHRRQTNTSYYKELVKLFHSGFDKVYTGYDAVILAVMLGENEVCSSVHSVAEKVDEGPILVQSKRLPVDKKIDNLRSRKAYGAIVDYARELQDEMKTECDGPAFREALKLLADDRMVVEDNVVYLDGQPLPYGGVQL